MSFKLDIHVWRRVFVSVTFVCVSSSSSSCSPQQQPISLECVPNSILLLGATKPFTLDLEEIFEQYGMENIKWKNKNRNVVFPSGLVDAN